MQENSSLRDAEPMFRAVIASGGVFTLRPRGTSMLPTIVPGRDDVSIVRLEGRAELYDILFYQRADGHFILHRVLKVCPDSYTLCGDAQIALEPGVTDSMIIGVVQSIHRPDGDLVRGTPEFLAAARRRARANPLRLLRYRLAVIWHRMRGR